MLFVRIDVLKELKPLIQLQSDFFKHLIPNGTSSHHVTARLRYLSSLDAHVGDLWISEAILAVFRLMRSYSTKKGPVGSSSREEEEEDNFHTIDSRPLSYVFFDIYCRQLLSLNARWNPSLKAPYSSKDRMEALRVLGLLLIELMNGPRPLETADTLNNEIAQWRCGEIASRDIIWKLTCSCLRSQRKDVRRAKMLRCMIDLNGMCSSLPNPKTELKTLEKPSKQFTADCGDPQQSLIDQSEPSKEKEMKEGPEDEDLVTWMARAGRLNEVFQQIKEPFLDSSHKKNKVKGNVPRVSLRNTFRSGVYQSLPLSRLSRHTTRKVAIFGGDGAGAVNTALIKAGVSVTGGSGVEITGGLVEAIESSRPNMEDLQTFVEWSNVERLQRNTSIVSNPFILTQNNSRYHNISDSKCLSHLIKSVECNGQLIPSFL